MMNYCLLIPHYNHLDLFKQLAPKLKKLGLPCVIVDDGSDPETLHALEQLVAEGDNCHLFAHRYNRGKGAAVITAFYHARHLGFTHGIQIDADGQHNLDDIEQFITYSKAHPRTIISGKPFFEDNAPKIRVYGRRVTDFWVALETLSLRIKDSLCGFRVYPLASVEKVIDAYHIGPRMNFDTDILVKAVWADIPLHFIPTKVIYHENSVSHFHYLRDNALLIQLHCKLLTGMLIRLPWLLYRRITELFCRKQKTH